jgi:cytosine/adenosine deaminase-related metal-dependent hydrolase
MQERFGSELTGDFLITADWVLAEPGALWRSGAVWVRAGRVAAVGGRSEFPEKLDCPVVELPGRVLAPGLVNAHAHIEYACLAGQFEPEAFPRWLGRMIAAKRSLALESIPDPARRALDGQLRRGTTSIGDISTFGISPALLRASGMRFRVFQEVIGLEVPPETGGWDDLEGRLGVSAFDLGLLGALGVAPHAPYTVSKPLMSALRRRFQTEPRALPFSIHLAETRSERTCLERQSGFLARGLRRAGFYPAPPDRAPLASSPLDFVTAGRAPHARDLVVHGNFLKADEMRHLAAMEGVSLVVCPGTRLFHGVREPALDRAHRVGLPVALGTDSAASNDCPDLWSEMRRALEQSRLWRAADAWRAATVGGAEALGLECGALRPGLWADLMAVRLDGSAAALTASRAPGFYGKNEADALLDTWLRGDAFPEVERVWVGGKPVED